MWYKFAQTENLEQKLKFLRTSFAKKAQEIYDSWDEDIEVYAGGGICHLIADGFVEILSENFPDLASFTVSDPNEVHVYSAIINASFEQLEDETEEIFEIYYVDIYHSTYETGGGYSWKKIPNVIFDASDVSIYKSVEDVDNLKMIIEGF